ncbi:unnamed protein product [Somion occarium]|uniref:Uncharacterized protein n=1 Tax=Somion occarium TaxID=3059160 RepID=A0ABP1DYW1_9APHY
MMIHTTELNIPRNISNHGLTGQASDPGPGTHCYSGTASTSTRNSSQSEDDIVMEHSNHRIVAEEMDQIGESSIFSQFQPVVIRQRLQLAKAILDAVEADYFRACATYREALSFVDVVQTEIRALRNELQGAQEQYDREVKNLYQPGLLTQNEEVLADICSFVAEDY